MFESYSQLKKSMVVQNLLSHHDILSDNSHNMIQNKENFNSKLINRENSSLDSKFNKDENSVIKRRKIFID